MIPSPGNLLRLASAIQIAFKLPYFLSVVHIFVIKWPNHGASTEDISFQVSFKVLTLHPFRGQGPPTLL